MHGLIFETSICYWQDQPDILLSNIWSLTRCGATGRQLPVGSVLPPTPVQSTRTPNGRTSLFTTYTHARNVCNLRVPSLCVCVSNTGPESRSAVDCRQAAKHPCTPIRTSPPHTHTRTRTTTDKLSCHYPQSTHTRWMGGNNILLRTRCLSHG